MENRVNKKADKHILQFKNSIKEWIEDNNIIINGDSNLSEFLKFIYDYECLSFTKDDFAKRKRIRNTVASNIRCCACRADGSQCTRRKKENNDYCGTHEKGLPYGEIKNISCEPCSEENKLELWIEEIQGIHYYLDKNGNIYDHEDIHKNLKNPKIIAEYEKINNDYKISKFLN